MNQFLIHIAHKIGLDKSIAYSSGARIVQGVAGVGSVFFISTFLTGVEQGFYFTFGSILSMQVFFEMGLTGIMTQFVAHEASHLNIINSRYEGDNRYISRLASIVHFCVKWYFIIAFVLFVFLLATGNIFFSKYGSEHTGVSWQVPWLLVCLGTAIKFFQAPFTAIFNGLGYVKEMSRIIFLQQLIIPMFTWVGLIFNFKLYVSGVAYLISVIIWNVYVYRYQLDKIVTNLWSVIVTERVSYLKEIFPYQWRIALSWISGYFIFQLFNPVLFAVEGPKVAGQMGMTLQALNALQAISLSWLNTKVPFYSKLIALKNYFDLDRLFNKTLKQMVFICSLMIICFLCLIIILKESEFKIGDSVIGERFLDLFPLIMMIIPVFLQQFVSSWATYLRCHKREPFLINSICCALATGCSTLLLGKLYGVYGVTIGYCIISCLFFPWGYYIYYTKKREWHGR